MLKSLDELNAFHLEVFQEVGNIGAGNAATALASLVNKKIDMDVPRAGVVELSDLMSLMGNEEDSVICVRQSATGSAPCSIMFVLEENSAHYLANIFLPQPLGANEMDALEESFFLEIGNILSGSFMNAFAQITNLAFNLSVPALARDMLGAVLSSALMETGYFAEEVLVVETRFFDMDYAIRGHFFILPEIETLEKIFLGLGINF